MYNSIMQVVVTKEYMNSMHYMLYLMTSFCHFMLDGGRGTVSLECKKCNVNSVGLFISKPISQFIPACKCKCPFKYSLNAF